jgi:hypothetical protein
MDKVTLLFFCKMVTLTFGITWDHWWSLDHCSVAGQRVWVAPVLNGLWLMILCRETTHFQHESLRKGKHIHKLLLKIHRLCVQDRAPTCSSPPAHPPPHTFFALLMYLG